MIGFNAFVLANSGREAKSLSDEELEIWQDTYEEAMRYDIAEEKGREQRYEDA